MTQPNLIKFVDGETAKIVNRYFIHPYRHKYVKMDCVIYDNGDRIARPVSDRCETCNREFSEIRSHLRHYSTYTNINKKLGFVARICVDCKWFYEYQKGYDPPPPIRRFIAEGFKPRLI